LPAGNLPNGCLVLKQIRQHTPYVESRTDPENGKEVSKEEEYFDSDFQADPTVLVGSEKNQTIFVEWEYHIVYDTTYQVPALYFRASKLSGEILNPNEIESFINETHQNIDEESGKFQPRMDFLTQEEHPVFASIFYMVHPCQIAERMSHFQQGSIISSSQKTYLLEWAALCLPSVVGLHISPKFFVAAKNLLLELNMPQNEKIIMDLRHN